MAEYADPVIDWLDQDQTMVSHRYFRQVKETNNRLLTHGIKNWGQWGLIILGAGMAGKESALYTS
jgi:hypothetical protein